MLKRFAKVRNSFGSRSKKNSRTIFKKTFFWWIFLWKARPAEKLPPKICNFFDQLSRKKEFARFVRSKKLKTTFVSENESGCVNVMLIGWPNVFCWKSETFLLETQNSFMKEIHKFIFLFKIPYRHLHNSFDEPVEKL